MTGQTLQKRRQKEQCPVFKIDRQGRFVYIDARTERFFGISAEELFVRNIEEFLDKESYDKLRLILDSGRSCEAFYFPLEATILDSSGKSHPYSAVVSQNFVAGNPANYQLIIIPRTSSSERREIYDATDDDYDVLAAMARIIASGDGHINFQQLTEAVIIDERILSIAIYKLSNGRPDTLSSATRRPYSGDDIETGILGDDVIASVISGQKIVRPASLTAEETLTSGERLVETILPIFREDQSVGLIWLVHEPGAEGNFQLPEQVARFFGCLFPAGDKPSGVTAETAISDVAARVIFENVEPLICKIDENIDRILEQFSKEIKGYGREFIDNISSSSTGIKTFLRRLRNCYHADPANREIYHRTDLNRVFRDVYQKLSMKNPGRNVFLKNVSLPIIHTDESRVHEIFECILSNSFRFHDPNETLEVEVISRSTESELTLCLGDNGPGLPVNYAEDIFRPFWVIPDPGHSYPQGPGMGLAIARTLARSLGGDIRLGTPCERGTVMEIILPNQ
jgi:PAS domain S-box-containing protein